MSFKYISDQAPRRVNKSQQNDDQVFTSSSSSSSNSKSNSDGSNDFLIALLVIGGLVAVWVVWQMLSCKKKATETIVKKHEQIAIVNGIANSYYRGSSPCITCEKPPGLWPTDVPVKMKHDTSSENDTFFHATFLDVGEQ